MARKEKRYHYIYKTVCMITKMYYVGMHSTDNLEDGYKGSGKRLRYSIKKYGVENHIVEILEFLPNRSSLKAREAEIINENFLQDKLCMNIVLGGGGGFEAAKIKLAQIRNNLEWRKNYSEKMSKSMKLAHKEGRKNGNTFSGKFHSEETKQKMSQKASERTGDKNSQFGTCWITNGSENKKIKKNEDLPTGWSYGRTKQIVLPK